MHRMNRRTWLRAASLSVFLPAGITEAMERAFLQAPIGSPNAEEKRRGDAMTESAKVYELRIYHVVPGKLDSLVARFRDYTDKLFAKHGMKSVAYWTALDEPVKSSTLFYILEHPPRGGGRELESLPGRCGMEDRESQVRREWQTGGEH